MSATIRVITGSRLHFGLFSLPSVEAARSFGGVGMMVDGPAVIVRARFAKAMSASGPCAERALAVAQRLAESLDNVSFAIEVEACPPEHMGLGTGTQLDLAVATALHHAAGGPTPAVPKLAERLGRGQRSALGIHGFVQGGFLVEGGKGPHTSIAPLVAWVPFPESWRVLLILPRALQGYHGQREREAFAQLAQKSPLPEITDALCRLTLLGMLPALREAELEAFGDALFEFNRKVGDMFRPAQGGIYSHPKTEELVTYLRQQGVHGVGQSSWGPCVFAVVADDRAADLAELVQRKWALGSEEVIIAGGRNRGAVIEK